MRAKRWLGGLLNDEPSVTEGSACLAWFPVIGRLFFGSVAACKARFGGRHHMMAKQYLDFDSCYWSTL